MRIKKRILYWMPRILSTLFVLFLFAMSLDIISPELGAWQIAVGMLMHNIPAIILLGVLFISWKYEIVGGIVFILAGLLYIIFTAHSEIPWYLMISWSMTIAGPAFLIGILFLVDWYHRKH